MNEQYLDESDFDEIKRQKRHINPALINNITSLINDHSSSKSNLTRYDHSTAIKMFIESANLVPISNQTDESLDRKRRLRSKRQTEAVTNGK